MKISLIATGDCHDVYVEPGLQPLTGENLSYCSAFAGDGAQLLVVFGGFHFNVLTLMYVCSIPMPHLINQYQCQLVIAIMSNRRGGLMTSGYMIWKWDVSHYLSFLLLCGCGQIVVVVCKRLALELGSVHYHPPRKALQLHVLLALIGFP